MRKILGSILLFAMLITAVPVMAAAETDSPSTETGADAVDLHALYVTKGLVSHFSVFGGAKTSADLAEGVWRDRVSGATATLGNKSYWERRADGSIGFDILYGVYENGKVTVTEDPAQPLATDRYAANATYAETRLGFGLALLPEDDFTVEYVAKYNPIYVATPEGEIARNADGSYMELYVKTGHGALGAENAGPADHIGFLSSFATERDGTYGTVMLERGSVRWHFSDIANPTWDSPIIGGNSGGLKGAFIKRDGIHTYAIVRDEDVDKEGALSAIYTLWRDTSAQSYKKSVTLSVARSDAGRTYYDKKDVGDFYLSSQTPTDFYSVRIYNRTLTVAERTQNRFADLLLYYGISIPASFFADDALMESLYHRAEEVGFLTDAVARAAFSASLQAAVDGERLRAHATDLYAARESMTAFFTSFVPGSVDLTAGSWTDLITGHKATLGDAARWSFSPEGGIGFHTFCGEMVGEYFRKEGAGDNYTTTSAKLNFGVAILPADDFTVEYLAMYKPVYVYDKSTSDNIARDSAGNKLETYDYERTVIGLHLNRTAIDQIGWFSSYSEHLDGIGSTPWGEPPRGSLHWQFDNPSWYSGHNGLWLGKRWTRAGGLNKLDDVLRKNNEVLTYAITLDETLTVAEDGTRETTGLFSLYRDGVFYNSNEAEEALNSTANNGVENEWHVYADIDETPSGAFWLSATQPTDFFSVRVYNRTLTEAEMAQNRTADLLYYYGISIPEQLYGNTAAMTQLTAAIGTVKFATDSAERAACVAQIETALAALKTATVPVYAYGSLVGNIETLSGVCVLPTAFAGREVLAWQSGTVTHKSGTVVPVTEGLTLTAVLASAPAITGAPTAYVTDKEAELGIRFAASFARAEYDALAAIFGAEGVRLGILVTPAQYVQMARGIFTREALSAMVTASGSTSGAAFVEIPMTAIPDAGDITVAGVLYHFHATTLAKNPMFAAIAFADIDTDGDGTFDKTFYGSYNAAHSATAKATIAAAREQVPALAQGWIDTLIAKFVG